MTKLIAVVIIIAALYAGWEFFLYYDRVKNDKEAEQKQTQVAVNGDLLPGMPPILEASLQTARTSPAGLKAWLKTYGASIQDPRKAWIELDYVVLVAREDPAEARKVFEAIKERTPPSSPVWNRIKQLQKTYE